MLIAFAVRQKIRTGGGKSMLIELLIVIDVVVLMWLSTSVFLYSNIYQHLLWFIIFAAGGTSIIGVCIWLIHSLWSSPETAVEGKDSKKSFDKILVQLAEVLFFYLLSILCWIIAWSEYERI